MYGTIPNKHFKTLTRRLDYLLTLKKEDSANSYDLAEIAALEKALEVMEYVRSENQRILEETYA